MSLSSRALETLIDLVEIKLSCLEVIDREDARERDNLQQCLSELTSLAGGSEPTPVAPVVSFAPRGRRRAAAAAG